MILDTCGSFSLRLRRDDDGDSLWFYYSSACEGDGLLA